MGVWKRKEGTVKQVTPENYIVEVDKITLVDGNWIGQEKVLRNPKIYRPYKRCCKLIDSVK